MSVKGQTERANDKMRALLIKAFQLAYFIWPDAEMALRIATSALEVLEVTCESQDKRRYYNLKGWLTGDRERKKRRTRVNMREEQLLQRLVYKFVHHYESNSERGHSLSNEDKTIRYLMHIVALTLKNNAFQVTVGFSRILHRYSNRETIEIYSALATNRAIHDQADLERECKRYKVNLMKELHNRLPKLLKTRRTEHDEERFESVRNSTIERELISECLSRLMPWGTECTHSLHSLAYGGRDPDGEHEYELKRMHSIIHPDCFARLTGLLGLAHPYERIEIPLFAAENSNDRDNNHRDRRQPPNIDNELDQALAQLAATARVRKSSPISLLSIIVDGQERALLDTRSAKPVHLELPADAELIEVREQNSALLLASHLLTATGSARRPRHFHRALPGGGKLELTISDRVDGDEHHYEVDIRYCAPIFSRAAAAALTRINNSLNELATRPAVRLATVALLIVLILTGKYALDLRREVMALRQAQESLRQRADEATALQQELAQLKREFEDAQARYQRSQEGAATPLATISDNNRELTLNDKGELSGLDGLSADQRQIIATALQQGRMEIAPQARNLAIGAGPLMGAQTDSPLTLLSPAGQAITTSQPELRWQPVDGASGYRLGIYDQQFNELITSDDISETVWRAPQPLRRGRSYYWQVRARVGSGTVTSPPAKFFIISQQQLTDLKRAQAVNSRLATAIFAARAGLIKEAERQLTALQADNPQSPVVMRLLTDLKKNNPQRQRE